ncbi:hypothetical protein UUU_41350 [Klebsiella pneumoniae subsp. pneumoniae DSM 30104 = JCM 1662 = NBRC 14940]|nr:hypothetical protein UUU_41350 [Klebsiella pneumoniae subsp. pneumoniae DSM 30104 = JCM 1662 = NBRC 14940]
MTISVKAILPALLTCCPAISKPITSASWKNTNRNPLLW